MAKLTVYHGSSNKNLRVKPNSSIYFTTHKDDAESWAKREILGNKRKNTSSLVYTAEITYNKLYEPLDTKFNPNYAEYKDDFDVAMEIFFDDVNDRREELVKAGYDCFHIQIASNIEYYIIPYEKRANIKWLDKEILTEEFIEKTGMSYYDDVLHNESYAKRKARFTKIIQMSPKAYIEACVEGFNTNRKLGGGEPTTTYDSLYTNRSADSETIQELKDKIQNGEMGMPVLEYSVKNEDYVYFTQEGIHRAIAALELGINRIPVCLCVSKDYKADETVTEEALLDWLNHFKTRFNEHIQIAALTNQLSTLLQLHG